MQEEKFKICKTHGYLDGENIYLEKNKNYSSGYQVRCRPCKTERDLKYRSSRRQELSKKTSEYKQQNREKVNTWTREDRKKKPDLYAASSKRHRDKLGAFRTTYEIARVRGISTDQYDALLISQNYLCAICSQPERRKNRNGVTARLCLDHNHRTNQIREFLCHNCNTMLGKFTESIEIIESAITYLKIHGDVCKK